MRDDWPEWRGVINLIGPVDDPATSFYTAPLPAAKRRKQPPSSPHAESAACDLAVAYWRDQVWMRYDGMPGSYTYAMKAASNELAEAFEALEEVEEKRHNRKRKRLTDRQTTV